MNNKHKGTRETNDFYPSPPEAVRCLLDYRNYKGGLIFPNLEAKIWENACGDGAICKVLEEYGYKNIYATDLIDRGYERLNGLGDFIYNFQTEVCDYIITNPPYNIAVDFIKRGKNVCNDRMAYLLRTNFLESLDRYPLFKSTQFPLSHVLQFSNRLSMYPNGDRAGRSGGMTAYAWFIFDINHKGLPTIDWVKY